MKAMKIQWHQGLYLNHPTGTVNHMDDDNLDSGPLPLQELSFRMSEYFSDTMRHVPTNHDIEEDEESKVQTLEYLFQKT